MRIIYRKGMAIAETYYSLASRIETWRVLELVVIRSLDLGLEKLSHVAAALDWLCRRQASHKKGASDFECLWLRLVAMLEDQYRKLPCFDSSLLQLHGSVSGYRGYIGLYFKCLPAG